MISEMKIQKRLIFILASMILLFCTAVEAQKPIVKTPQSDFLGSVKNGTYNNPFLGFELVLPNSWISLSKEDQDTAKSVGSEGLKSQKATNDREIDKAVGAETLVLVYAKKPLGAPGNSSLAVGFARQPTARITPKMVVEAAKGLLLKSPENKLIRDVEVEQIGGKQFASMTLDMNLYGQNVRLIYYATMIRDYSVSFSMSVADQEAQKEIDASLRSIKFTTK